MTEQQITKLSQSSTQNPCIWMQAHVVDKKKCTNHYHCNTCKYDAAMGKNAAAGKHLSWQESMRLRDSSQRTCRHALTGRVSHRTCPMNYNCNRCDFDQALEDVLCPSKAMKGFKLQDIKGFKIPEGFAFHSGHTWAVVDEGGFIRVGMDDFAFKVFGTPDQLELPLMGQELNAGKPGWGMHRSSNAADIVSPINGVITSVNPEARQRPDLCSGQPYEDGWLFTVHNRNLKSAVKGLFANETSHEWLDSEVTTLENMIEEVAGPLSADGGLLANDVWGNLPDLGWENLNRTFLKR